MSHIFYVCVFISGIPESHGFFFFHNMSLVFVLIKDVYVMHTYPELIYFFLASCESWLFHSKNTFYLKVRAKLEQRLWGKPSHSTLESDLTNAIQIKESYKLIPKPCGKLFPEELNKLIQFIYRAPIHNKHYLNPPWL